MKIKHQRIVKGKTRVRLGTCAETAIDRAIRREARTFGVSRSFVIAVSVAFALGVDIGAASYKPVPFRVIRGWRKVAARLERRA